MAHDIKIQLSNDVELKCKAIEETYVNDIHKCTLRFDYEAGISLSTLHENFSKAENLEKITVRDNDEVVSEITGLNKVVNISWRISQNDSGEFSVMLSNESENRDGQQTA